MGCDKRHLKTLELFSKRDSMRSRMAGVMSMILLVISIFILAPSGRLACVFTLKITHVINQNVICVTKHPLESASIKLWSFFVSCQKPLSSIETGRAVSQIGSFLSPWQRLVVDRYPVLVSHFLSTHIIYRIAKGLPCAGGICANGYAFCKSRGG